MFDKLRFAVDSTRDLGLRTIRDMILYHFRCRRYARRFGTCQSGPAPAASPVPDLCPGAVTCHTRQGQTVTLACAHATYAFTILAPDLIRVRLLPGRVPPETAAGAPFSYAVAKTDDAWPACDFQLIETGAAVEIVTAQLVLRVDRARGTLAFLDRAGDLISEEVAPAGLHPGGSVGFRRAIQPDEHFYGLGERTFGLDLRGRSYAMWNTDPHSYQLGQDPIHICIPVLLGLHSRGQQGYGIFFDNTFRGQFDLGGSDPGVAAISAEGGELRYYFFYGPALDAVLERYTELTGRIALPPLWMLGYHQSRWSYYPEARVRKLAADFREVYRVPCDGIHLDIHYMDDYRSFTWDPRRFPDPPAQAAALHAQGFKLITIIDPGIKADPQYRVCRSGLEQDVFCKYPGGQEPFEAPVWPGDCYFPDFTNPRVRDWWGDLYGELVAAGVDGTWNDMNEPAVFGLEGGTMPPFVQHDLEGRGGDHAEAHNVYGMQMARATHAGLDRLQPNGRPVCITRSGWAGVQRYAMSWTGDNRSEWGHLWQSMPMLMNLGLSGVAHTGPDAGGFLGFAGGEMFTRWLQMGAFLPFFRSHTFVRSPDQEPWSWGQPYLDANRAAIELRYALLPYLYTAFWQCAQSGRPIVRPLLLAFQDDPATHALDDQFMCGDALLVAPVLEEGAVRRSVYLPAGAWYDFWTGRRHEGPGSIEVEAPLDRLPLFVRAGSVVVTGPPLQYVGERPAEQLTLHLYPPQAGQAVESLLYEDDGLTRAFRDGDYRLTRFVLSSDERGLALQRRTEGRYAGECRGFEIVLHGVDRAPAGASVDGRPAACAADPTGHAVRVQAGLFDHVVLPYAANE